jgi:hypothetical protein
MPYPIKNTTLQQTNTVRTLNFAFGVNQGGYGLTSSTAFWNGKPPNVAGYIVYVGNGTSSPTMYVVATDSELINLSNTLGGGSNTTVQLALNYFINSANSVCLNVELPNIVTNGLVLYLDAGFTPSYPKGLATWYDMGPNLTNGTLTNGPTFSNDGGGSIVFDGSDDFVQIPYSTYWDTNVFGTATNFTLECWYKPDLFKNWDTLIEKSEASGWYSRSEGAAIWTDSGNIQGVFASGVDGNPGGSVVVLSYPTTTLKWYHIVFTGNGTVLSLYVDGVLRQTGLVSSRTVAVYNGSVGPRLGRRAFMDGQMSSVRFYTLALTQQEVLQNYYAGLERFIPTDNLVLWLDGTNTNTRVITPTTAYDRSGNNYNGTFINSTALAHRDGGTVFSFDGVDDIIRTEYNGQLGDFTVCVWFKSDNSGNWARLVDKSYSDGLWLGKQFNVPNSWGGGAGPQTTYPYGNFLTLPDGQWNFLVSIRNGSTHTLYGNGITNTVSQACSPVLTSTSKIGIGSWWAGIEYFKGKIGDVRLYSRALTADEVLNMYTATKSRYGL